MDTIGDKFPCPYGGWQIRKEIEVKRLKDPGSALMNKKRTSGACFLK